MLVYCGSEDLHIGVCWPGGGVHQWVVGVVLERVSAGMSDGQYHMSVWPDRVVPTGGIPGMREALGIGFQRRGLCCEWIRWEVDQDEVMVVSLRGLEIRHVELKHFVAGWVLCCSIRDYDYETSDVGVVTYVGVCLEAGNLWGGEEMERMSHRAMQDVAERECGGTSKYYYQHMEFERSRWRELGSDDYMGMSVAMFEFGKEVWEGEHVEVGGVVHVLGDWYDVGWRPADPRYGWRSQVRAVYSYRAGGVFTERDCRRSGGADECTSGVHFGLCLECRKKVLDVVYEELPYHWDSEIARAEPMEAGYVLGDGRRKYVLRQYAEYHWDDVRGNWWFNAGANGEGGTAESFPCLGGEHCVCICLGCACGVHICYVGQVVWTCRHIMTGAWGGDVSRCLCLLVVDYSQGSCGVVPQVRRVFWYCVQMVCMCVYIECAVTGVGEAFRSGVGAIVDANTG